MKKQKLKLKPTKTEGMKVGTKSDGKSYSVRDSRKRYFFPDEWERFIKTFKNKEHRFYFITNLHNGGRSMEELNIKHKHINIERETITLDTVKQRVARSDYSKSDGGRTFFVASNFIKEYKSFIRGKKINTDNYIFLDNSKLPGNYDSLNNKEKQKYWKSQYVSYSGILKRHCKKAGIKDWYMFSLHNLKKTYGMWMRVFSLGDMEMCYRMGDDMKTYMKHYGSTLIFTAEERRKIEKIMGDVK